MSSKVSFWLKNARPISLPQSLLPALTAVALSIGVAQFNWIAAIASVFGVILLHLGLNLMDDWFDYKAGSAEARTKVLALSDLTHLVQGHIHLNEVTRGHPA